VRAITVCVALAAVLALGGCGGGNPGPAANMQACKEFAAYENAVASGAVLQSEEINGSAGPVAHRMAMFLVSSFGKADTEISEPLRHDLARLLVDAVLTSTSQQYLNDDVRATLDCALVKSSHGVRA
jgi:hypothetical protein